MYVAMMASLCVVAMCMCGYWYKRGHISLSLYVLGAFVTIFWIVFGFVVAMAPYSVDSSTNIAALSVELNRCKNGITRADSVIYAPDPILTDTSKEVCVNDYLHVPRETSIGIVSWNGYHSVRKSGKSVLTEHESSYTDVYIVSGFGRRYRVEIKVISLD